MSSIIKGGRIRSQTVVNLAERFTPTYDEENEEQPLHKKESENLSAIEQKLQEAEEKAMVLIEEAKVKAENILSEAVAKAKEIETRAQIEKTELLFSIKSEEAKVLEEARKEKEAIIEAAYQEKQQIKEATEGELVETLMTILEHIAGEGFYQNTDWLLCMVRKLLSDQRVREPLTLFVSMQLKSLLSEAQINDIEALRKTLTVQEDPELEGTMCRLETAQGNIIYDIANGFNQMLSEIQILKTIE